ncbi:MAG: hypothetical protein ACNS62_22240, partial [Candidatus Cyclobacteriaceae bacterium M3_2C_046]
MILVKHPLEKYNKSQENIINSCPADQKRYHELIFSYGNAAYRYHQLNQNNITKEDWLEWLEGLETKFRDEMQKQGFSKTKNILSFTRYINEKRDIGQEE